MSDNELLLAISGMMDRKLKPLQKDISSLQNDISNMKSEMMDIKAQIKETNVRIDMIETNINKIEVIQENEILPRLQNIESCYTSTYNRYAKGVEQIENTLQDMSLIKTVVTEHSAKLEKIS